MPGAYETTAAADNLLYDGFEKGNDVDKPINLAKSVTIEWKKIGSWTPKYL